ncbi:MAG: mycothiol conjugate amidase Mca [Mycobacteriales bacterium]
MMVHAHPDDESSKGAATCARYVAEGVDVLVVTLTGGERGSVLNPAMDRPEVHANLAAIRREEMARAAAALGVRHRWVGFVDSGLPEGDPPPPLPPGCFASQPIEVASHPLVAIIRAERPHVVVTYDETGGYPHPDHVMCHRVSVEAFEAAGDPARYPGTGDPYSPLKLYYHASHLRERMLAFHEAMRQAGLDSPYEERLKAWADRPSRTARITTRVPCAEFFPDRDRALLAHATQIDPGSWWFACPLEIQQRVWPTEDYELARALVDTSLPEDDLFAGVRAALVETAANQ